jgi:hypothetical protein
MKFKNQIALYLQVAPSEITKITDLYYVWCVVVAGKRPRFISKKKVLEPKTIKPVTWCLKSETRRQEYNKKWVARIIGTCPKWGLARQFLAATETEWGKYGLKTAKYEISEPGFYQDSDGDYFKAWVTHEGEIDAEICSKMEVQHHFALVKV